MSKTESFTSKYWYNPNKFGDDILIQIDSKYPDVWITTTGGYVYFRHEHAHLLAKGFVRMGNPIEPLIDWAIENVELSGHRERQVHVVCANPDRLELNRKLLERCTKALASVQEAAQ